MEEKTKKEVLDEIEEMEKTLLEIMKDVYKAAYLIQMKKELRKGIINR